VVLSGTVFDPLPMRAVDTKPPPFTAEFTLESLHTARSLALDETIPHKAVSSCTDLEFKEIEELGSMQVVDGDESNGGTTALYTQVIR